MSTSGKRKCIVCGTEYEFCGRCPQNNTVAQTWRTIYCSENCKNIFNVVSLAVHGHLKKHEAQSMLNNLDLSRFEHFRNDFKSAITDIRRIDNTNINSNETEKQVKHENRFQKPFQPKGKKEFVKDDSKKE